MNTALVPVALSQDQLVHIATLAHARGLQQHAWENITEFVTRVVRELDRHPELARDITINMINVCLPPPPPLLAYCERELGISKATVTKTALWAARIGLAAFGIYTIF